MLLNPRKTREEELGAEDSSVPVSPYRTTSTEAIDTEEGQEITRFIKEKAYQRQRALTLQKVKTGGPIYDLPRPLSFQYLNLKITGAEVLKGLPVLRQWLQCHSMKNLVSKTGA